MKITVVKNGKEELRDIAYYEGNGDPYGSGYREVPVLNENEIIIYSSRFKCYIREAKE